MISFSGHDQSRRFNDHHRADGPWKRRSHPGNHLQKNENEQVSQTFTILPPDKLNTLPLDRLSAIHSFQVSKNILKIVCDVFF